MVFAAARKAGLITEKDRYRADLTPLSDDPIIQETPRGGVVDQRAMLRASVGSSRQIRLFTLRSTSKWNEDIVMNEKEGLHQEALDLSTA